REEHQPYRQGSAHRHGNHGQRIHALSPFFHRIKTEGLSLNQLTKLMVQAAANRAPMPADSWTRIPTSPNRASPMSVTAEPPRTPVKKAIRKYTSHCHLGLLLVPSRKMTEPAKDPRTTSGGRAVM